jgi:putative redox protein
VPKTVEAEVVFRGGMKFEGKSGRSGKTVELDFAPEGGEVAGFLPLELLLASLAACSGQVVVGLLKRMGQDAGELRVAAHGVKREIHPTVFTAVELRFEFRGGRVDAASVEKAIALSEDRFCPVWAMLKTVVPIAVSHKIL